MVRKRNFKRAYVGSYALLPVLKQITAEELYKNPELVRDIRELGHSENVAYYRWPRHIENLAWEAKRAIVDHKGRLAPQNLDILLPPDYVEDDNGDPRDISDDEYLKYEAMIENRFRTAFEDPVPANVIPYFQNRTLKFWAIVATILAAARPEIAEHWNRQIFIAANDNIPF